MTSFRIEEVSFKGAEIRSWGARDGRFSNWPVVYTISGGDQIYVGETRNATQRLVQHLDSTGKRSLKGARVIVDETFNKSACLDLEAFLIQLFAGDGQYQVLNISTGTQDADYYRRAEYRQTFREIFDELRSRGAFTRPIHEIENTDLYKLSPFKSLTHDQAIAVEDILEGLFSDLSDGVSSRSVIQGNPGTGKTVVGIYLMKLIADIQRSDPEVPVDSDGLLAEFFVEGHRELLQGLRAALVVPQQSLRQSIKSVFRKTPGLHPNQVLGPFQVGAAAQKFDLLIIDEAHRLNQRAAQAAGPLNKAFRDININLFGSDDVNRTQVDWIVSQSTHQIFLVDGLQSVRPADLAPETVSLLITEARAVGRHHQLSSQMRVRAQDDYVGYVRDALAGRANPRRFEGYDLRFYESLGEMQEAIARREEEVGLSRLVAGFAWKWISKNNPALYDIVEGGVSLRWNSTDRDWVNSPNSASEVGSIHTIQGYDLNYAGVVIGRDLTFDPQSGRIVFDRENYFDSRGMTNNRFHGVTYSDDDILGFVRNIYAVLLTRGMLGTYVYVCDEKLRQYLAPYFAALPSEVSSP